MKKNPLYNNIIEFAKKSTAATFEEKYRLIDNLIGKIIWDGNSFSVFF